MVRPVALVAVAALTLGCGSFSAAEKPTDDAGVSGADAGTATDAAVTRPDAGAGSPCVADPSIVFCEDFDDPTRAMAPFRFAELNVNPPSAGRVTLENVGIGGTNAAVVELAQGAGSRSIWLGRDLGVAVPSKVASYELAYDVMVIGNTLQYTVLGTLAFLGPGYTVYPGVAAFTNASLGATVDPGASDPMITTNVVGVWHHCIVDVKRGGAAAYDIQISIDGAPVGNPVPIKMDLVNDVRIQLGAFFTSPESGAAQVVLDNVVVRTTL